MVFGGTGDLARRKLLPALFYRERDGQLPPESRIIGVSRGELGRAAYAAEVEARCASMLPAEDIDAGASSASSAGSTTSPSTPPARRLGRAGARLGGAEDRVRVFYLATAPELFGPICRRLGAAGL